jgi:BASS family bile acid:Na+ symporter
VGLNEQALVFDAKLVAAGAVISMVASLGLNVTLEQLMWVFRRPGLLVRSVVAVLILVPLIALFIALHMGLEKRAIVGIVLMGVSPAAPLILWRVSQSHGDTNFAPGIQVIVAVLAVASVPLWLAVLSRMFPNARATVSPWVVAGQVGRAQLIPLALGMGVRARWPALAARLARPLARLAVILLLVFVVAALAFRAGDLSRLGFAAYAAIGVTLALSLAVGHVLGGPAPQTRTVLAVVCAMRNPGLALLIAELNFQGKGVGRVLLAYALVSLIFLSLYGIWRKRPDPPASLGS